MPWCALLTAVMNTLHEGILISMLSIVWFKKYNKGLEKLRDVLFKTKTKTKTLIFVLELRQDQDTGRADYISGLSEVTRIDQAPMALPIKLP